MNKIRNAPAIHICYKEVKLFLLVLGKTKLMKKMKFVGQFMWHILLIEIRNAIDWNNLHSCTKPLGANIHTDILCESSFNTGWQDYKDNIISCIIASIHSQLKISPLSTLMPYVLPLHAKLVDEPTLFWLNIYIYLIELLNK